MNIVNKEELIYAALLHDIGKIFHYYTEHPLYKKWKGHKWWHAYASAELLRLKKFPDNIVDLVKNHHEDPPKSCLLKLIKRADTLDASFRRHFETKEVKGKPISLPIIPTKRASSLHGEDPLKIIMNYLKPKKSLEYYIAQIKECTSLLRADQRISDISLYVHLILTTAILSCLMNDEEPYVIIIECDTRERARFATIERVEYLSGLQIYAYFGLLASIARTLQGTPYNPSIHIISESPLHIIVLMPRSLINKLKENLKKLSKDINTKIKVVVISLLRAYRKDEEIIEPEMKLVVWGKGVACSYCKEYRPQSEVIKFGRYNVCYQCAQITMAHKYLGKSRIFSIVEGIYKGGLVYRSLNISVLTGKANKALLMRYINPKTSEDIVREGVIATDLIIQSYRKDLKVWILIRLEDLIKKILDKKEIKFHKYISLCHLIVPLFKEYLTHEHIDNYSIIRCDPIYAILQVEDESIALKIAHSMLTRNISSVITRAGSPGITYLKIINKAENIKEPSIIINEEIIKKEYIEKAELFLKRLSTILGIEIEKATKLVSKVFINLYSRLSRLKNADALERALIKSELLCMISEILKSETITLFPFYELRDPRETLSEIVEESLDDMYELLNTIYILYNI